jgi:hypothetical protein
MAAAVKAAPQTPGSPCQAVVWATSRDRTRADPAGASVQWHFLRHACALSAQLHFFGLGFVGDDMMPNFKSVRIYA